MKPKLLSILFALAYAASVFLTIALVYSVERLRNSTPFVKDIMFLTLPLIGGSLSSYVFYSILLFTLAPVSVIGCLIAFLKSPPRNLVNSFYTFHLVFGIILLFMQDQSYNKEDANKWDMTHHNLKCCGYDNYEDWFVTPNERRTNVPDSCCFIPIKRCGMGASGKDRIEEKIYTRGCYPVLCDQIRNIRLIYLSVVFIILAIPSVMFVRRIRSWMLAMRRQRD